MTPASEVLAALDYPMLVVTAAAGEERAGCLVGFAAQCSIDPVRLVVWVSKANRTYRVAERSEALGVHFLAAGQRDLAVLFGGETGDRVDKFARCRWHPGPRGVPLLDDCSRWIVGRILRRDDGGDHVGHLLVPVEASAGEWEGQLGFQAVRDLDPGHAA
jgi:flavin reductase (DIM6/NTAB) family NADH-FMN oxidoreductase RutF